MVFAACDPEQEVSPVIDASQKALVSITRTDDGTGSAIVEGDVLEFEITTSKMLKNSVDFAAILTEGSGVDESDFEVEGGVLNPFTTKTTMSITVLNDGFPELGEKLEFEIGAFDIAQNWILSPESDIEEVSLDVANVNEAGVITIALSWPNHDDDLDLYIYSVAADDFWGSSAGSDNPEITTALWPSDPNGTYYVGFDPYHLDGEGTDYTISIGFEDGTVQIFNGRFELADIDTYQVDGGALRLLQIDLTDGQASIINSRE